ncbi:Icl1f, partial [Symbiodinium pilosum]
DGYVAFGSLAEVQQAAVEHLNAEPAVQQRRRPERLSARIRDLDTGPDPGRPGFVLGTLCPDLTFCPGGATYELKL